MFIGEVAKRTGLSVKAIRFYEEKGLIATPVRQGRYRRYTEQHIEVLNLIAEAKTLGVTLAELKGVIRFRDGEVDWPAIDRFLRQVRGRLEAELAALNDKIGRVDACIAVRDRCRGG